MKMYQAMLKGCLVIALCWLAPAYAKESLQTTQRPMLWNIQGTNSWLFGTIHLADKRLAKLPIAAEIAFRRSDAVFTEIAMEPAMMMSMGILLKRKDGKTLKQVLPADLYNDLDRFLRQKRGIGVAVFEQMKTWVPYMVLAGSGGLQQSGEVLDIALYNRAKENKKQVGGLETAVEQISYFDRFSESEIIEMLREGLTAYGKVDVNEELLKWYLAGDANSFEQLMEKLAAPNANKTLQEKFTAVLLVERNQLMAERINKKLKANPEQSFFFAVGAAHLAGEKSVQHFLKQLGYQSKRIGIKQ